MADLAPPSPDEFDAWLNDPVTRFVLTGVQRFADGQREQWSEKAWNGDLDPITRERYRTRADAYEGLAGMTLDVALGLHPDTDGETA